MDKLNSPLDYDRLKLEFDKLLIENIKFIEENRELKEKVNRLEKQLRESIYGFCHRCQRGLKINV